MASSSAQSQARSTSDEIASSPQQADNEGRISLPLEIESAELAPADRGRAAWLVLAGCSIIQTPVWGFSVSFGVYQNYYSKLGSLEGSSYSIATIGTSASGILYLSSPFIFALLSRYPHLRRWSGPLGLLITIVGFFTSSFANSIGGLVATQGVIAAIGGGLLYSPVTLYMDEWWVRRKGLAYGVMLASKALSGVIIPFVMDAALRRFGFRITMRAWSVAILLLTAPLLFFLKPRIPLSPTTTPQKISLTFLTLPSFYILQASNLVQSLGYFLPQTYLSSYASTIGLNTNLGTLMIALVNGASIPGALTMGMLNDRLDLSHVILLSSVGSTLAVFIFWGLAGHGALLIMFAILYGFFAGGWSSTWSGMMKQMKRERSAIDTGLAFGLLSGVRGIGNVASGPLSAGLIAKATSMAEKNVRSGYETKYEWVIVFTGVTCLMSGWGWGWKACRRLIA